MKAKLKHTPGPWKISKLDRTVISPCNNEFDIADTWKHDRGKTKAQANARLIAAAPDMLELLIASYLQLNPDGWQWLRDDIKTTIERATGLSIEEIL